MDWKNIQADVTKILPCDYTAGREGANITGITIHHMAGNLSIDQCYNLWSRSQTSAHYAVQADGEIGQMVNDWDTAWACGNWYANTHTISIEHANNNSNPWTVFPAALESGAHLVAALCLYYNLGRPQWLVNVFPHRYWSATACPGELYGSQKDEYINRAQQWYDAMKNGSQAAPAPSTNKPTPAPAPTNKSAPGKAIVNVHYALRNLNGGWNGTITNFNNSDSNGFAGVPCGKHDYLCAWVDHGTLKYQVHTQQDGWLDYVSQGNQNDLVNGCAGIGGHAIDGVRMYYITPNGEEYKQAYYRSQTVDREGWLNSVCDDGSTYGGDDFAGMYGEALDRLQVCISDANPF